MKKFLKTTAISLAIVALFGSAMFVATGCELVDCDRGCDGDTTNSDVALITGSQNTNQVTDVNAAETPKEDSQATETTSNDAQSEEGAVIEGDIQLLSATYVEGEGADAVYEFEMAVSPTAVANGQNLGDVFVKVGETSPTLDDWEGINTYDSSMGEETPREDGGLNLKWKTSVYFPDKAPTNGQKVTIGVNVAGQDEDGNWSESEMQSTATIDWGSDWAWSYRGAHYTWSRKK